MIKLNVHYKANCILGSKDHTWRIKQEKERKKKIAKVKKLKRQERKQRDDEQKKWMKQQQVMQRVSGHPEISTFSLMIQHLITF